MIKKIIIGIGIIYACTYTIHAQVNPGDICAETAAEKEYRECFQSKIESAEYADLIKSRNALGDEYDDLKRAVLKSKERVFLTVDGK